MKDGITDERLAALFAAPDPAPDEAFVGRIERAVLAEQRMAAARRALWRRFAIETAGSIAVAAAFLLLGRLGPFVVDVGRGPFSPAVAAGLVLLLWLAVEMRPVPATRR
jgi:hypothetical protein